MLLRLKCSSGHNDQGSLQTQMQPLRTPETKNSYFTMIFSTDLKSINSSSKVLCDSAAKADIRILKNVRPKSKEKQKARRQLLEAI